MVVMPAPRNADQSADPSADPSADQSATDRDASPTVSLVEEMREQVAFLREELRREREARVEEKRRHDTIVLQLAQRIPELEAQRETGPETRDSPERASKRADKDKDNDVPPEPQESAQHRSWLYRFFFGP